MPRGLGLGITLFSALLYYALTTHGSFNPLYEQAQAGFAGQFFLAQGQALIHGHLNVAPAQIPGECWIHAGRCYGYFGLTPSLLRVPFLPLLDDGNRSLTSVYMTIALALAVGSALGIASRTLACVQRTPLITFMFVALAISLGPASVLAAVARPAVYEEAIAWSVGFGLLGIYGLLRWWTEGGRGSAILATGSLVLSANARPTTVALGVLLGVGVAVRALLLRPGRTGTYRALLFATALAVLPLAGAVGVYWLKFRVLVPNSLLNQQIGGPQAEPWWLAIRRLDHNDLQGLRFAPTALLAYVRPDGLAFSAGFPFVSFRFGPAAGTTFLGIPPGSLYVEPFSTLTDDIPLAIITIVTGFIYGLRQAGRRADGLRTPVFELLRSPFTYCILGAAGSAVIMLTQGVITNRYLCDFFPLIAIALPLAVRFLAPPVAQLSRGPAVVVVIGVCALLAWSLVMNLGLEYQSWWHTTI